MKLKQSYSLKPKNNIGLLTEEEKAAKEAAEVNAKNEAKAKRAKKPASPKETKKQEDLARVAAKAEKIDFGTIGVASASDKDNLQELKGIGPFIEEKLNALGIFKFEQIAKMTSKIEDEVNIAIEFFPGRVKRDEWVKQAKERTK